MSVRKWAYTPEVCDGDICVGDCDLCNKAQETVSAIEKRGKMKKLVVKYNVIQGKYGEQYVPEIKCPECGRKFDYTEAVTVKKCKDCGAEVML